MEDMEVEIAQDKNPLVTLARAAKYMNPMQFELPKDIAPTMNMPGNKNEFGMNFVIDLNVLVLFFKW